MACERYGWTVEYVMWGVSYLNVLMMLSDAISYDYDLDNTSSSHTPKVSNDKQIFKGNFQEFMKFAKTLKRN